MATVSHVRHNSLVPTVRKITECPPPLSPLFTPMKVLLFHQCFLSRYSAQLPSKKPFYLAIYPSGKQLNWKSREESCLCHSLSSGLFNPLKPNDLKKRRTAQLTSRFCILYIYSTNIRTEYFKHAA